MTSPARIIVLPYVAHHRVMVPEVVRKLTAREFRGSAILDDIDNNLLPASHPHKGAGKPTILGGSNLQVLLELARGGVRQTFITGSMFEHQEPRVIDPVREALIRSGETELMEQFALYASRGGVQAIYSRNGELDKAGLEKYLRAHGILPEDIPVIEEAAHRTIANYWGKYLGNPQAFHAKYPTVGEWREPEFQIRTPCEATQGKLAGQLAILPFIGEELTIAIKYLKSILPPGILERYEFNPGGKTTIDIGRKGVCKALAIKLELERLGIPLTPAKDALTSLDKATNTVLFGGDEVYMRLDEETGEPIEGNDVSATHVPNVVVLALNLSKEGLVRSKRVYHIGSGPAAAFTFKRWIAASLGRSEVDPNLSSPFLDNREVEVPEPVSRIIDSGFEGALLAIAASRITGFKYQKDINGILLDPAVLEITKLLRRNVPIAIVTGGDYKRRVIPILEALERILRIDNALQYLSNILLYSNGGALLSAFDKEGKRNDQIFEGHKARYAIKPEDLKMLKSILDALREEYMTGFEKEHFLEYNEPPSVEERSDGAQLSFLPLLRTEKGWLELGFYEKLQRAGLEGEYTLHSGGYALDVNRSGTDKKMCLVDALKRLGLPANAPVIYLGGEFQLEVDDKSGRILKGIDMQVLGLPNVFALAINENQEDERMPNLPSRLFRAGSGIPALAEWLKFFNRSLAR